MINLLQITLHDLMSVFIIIVFLSSLIIALLTGRIVMFFGVVLFLVISVMLFKVGFPNSDKVLIIDFFKQIGEYSIFKLISFSVFIILGISAILFVFFTFRIVINLLRRNEERSNIEEDTKDNISNYILLAQLTQNKKETFTNYFSKKRKNRKISI